VAAERPTGPPSSTDERALEQVQSRLTRAELDVERLAAERDRIALRLWHAGLPQAEIAERLDRADRRAGGGGISYAATQKRLWRSNNGLTTG
jgi:hypothetical protein